MRIIRNTFLLSSAVPFELLVLVIPLPVFALQSPGRTIVTSSSTTTRTTSTRIHQKQKDWDAIIKDLDNDDNDNNNENSVEKISWRDSIPNDMKYNLRNCQRLNKNFQAIQAASGPGADIYGCAMSRTTRSNRKEDTDDEKEEKEEEEEEEGTFWFLGKVAHISDVSVEECIQRLYPMILQHAANLRPLDLFGPVTNQELMIWYTPINSELDVAYNRPTTPFTKVLPPTSESSTSTTIPISFIGFQGEVYESNEEGFRTIRYVQSGIPARPEIVGPKDEDEDNPTDGKSVDPIEYDIPNDEQMEQIQSMLQGQDINAIYEEQERRRKLESETQ